MSLIQGGTHLLLSRCDVKANSDAHVAQSVEHFLGKGEVTGSSPVAGSTYLRKGFAVVRLSGGRAKVMGVNRELVEHGGLQIRVLGGSNPSWPADLCDGDVEVCENCTTTDTIRAKRQASMKTRLQALASFFKEELRRNLKEDCFAGAYRRW